MEGEEAMKQLIIKSNLQRNKMPEWLLFIIDETLSRLGQEIPVDGSREEFEYIQWMIDCDLKLFKLKTPVCTELVTDEGETVLFIKRSGRIIISIYIK